ncbi:UNVERIFIED_CONTAM: hypothetical protein K2H54_013530 [Gekko kuhli]
MNEPAAPPARVAICLVLLASCSLRCLAFRNTERRHARQAPQPAALAENRLEDSDNVSASSPEGRVVSPEQAAAASEGPYGASAEPSGISLSAAVKATPQTVLGVQGLSGHQGFPVYTTAVSGAARVESQLAPSDPEENDSHGSWLAAGVTSPNPNGKEPVFTSTASETGEGASEGADPVSTGSLGGDIFAPGVLEGGGSAGPAGAPLLTTEDSLFWLPSDQSASLPASAGQSLDVERVSNGDGPSLATGATAEPSLVSTGASFRQQGDASDSWGRSQVTPGAAAAVRTTALPSDDWDDTKPGAAGQAGDATAVAANQSQMAGESYPGEGREGGDDEVKRVLPPGLSAATAKGSHTLQTGPVQEPVRRGESTTLRAGQNTVRATELSPEGQGPPARVAENTERVAESHEAAATIDTTKSGVFQTLRNTLRGVTQEVAAAVHETDALLSTSVPGGFPSQDATGEGRWRELVTRIPEVLGSSAVPEKPEHFATPASPSATDLSVIPTPEARGPAAAFQWKDDVPAEDAPTTPAGLLTGEIPGATVATSALPSVAASARRTTIPAAPQVTTAAAYGLDGLESEEEEEEEEEEDEEEEEEEEPDEDDEEEDDEDEKEANSMDENMDGDDGPAGFTLPGETSQDPLENLENPVGELSGVSYQVPGDIEWERQNQGLVRNWMKKLKDKAGYMSGMLVPVGVGIAGALMILVTLYSVKIMNRRRRNSFKRHKQKQREFNSMQDRVMLLADSSEDEF